MDNFAMNVRIVAKRVSFAEIIERRA